MKAFLMHRDRDFDLKGSRQPHEAALTQDLELQRGVRRDGCRGRVLLEVARKAVLTSLQEPEAILYRQHVLADCLDRSAVVREMYAIAVLAIEREQRIWAGSPPGTPKGCCIGPSRRSIFWLACSRS